MDARYVRTVRLLLETAPTVFDGTPFAMKGGTAINLFVESMPRLSVDIDVVYTNFLKPRTEAIDEIARSLELVKSRLTERGLDVSFPTAASGEESKLHIRNGEAMVKVEVNHVFRGSVMEAQLQPLVNDAQSFFSMEVSVPVLAVAELYGSKLVAAMDRQHPRDLFDVLGMFRRDGLTPDIVECFVCYLAGHNRPVHEVLFARPQDIAMAYHHEFQGMTREPVELKDLLDIRERLHEELPDALTDQQRHFLIGLVAGHPQWSLMRCEHLIEMPAIRWKVRNLQTLEANNPAKFRDQERLLREKLELG